MENVKLSMVFCLRVAKNNFMSFMSVNSITGPQQTCLSLGNLPQNTLLIVPFVYSIAGRKLQDGDE